MMSCMLIMVVCICYLCHWRFQKAEERYERSHSWLQPPEPDSPIHIFTLDQQECYSGTRLYQDTEQFCTLPPPDYDSVMAACQKVDNESIDSDLPSYETALKLSSNGYV